MRLLLTAALLMTAASGAAIAEGRYVTTEIPAHPGVIITDSETGAVRFCRFDGYQTICTQWTM